MSSATLIALAGEAIWLNPSATVLFNMFGMFAVMWRKMLFSSVFAITERRDIGLYEVSLSMYLLDFGIGTMLANFHMCGIMLLLRSV